MVEIKYDVRRGADTYRLIYHSRLKSWILRDIIKRDEALVWRSGLSGWRKPEELEELKLYFEQREQEHLKREKAVERPILFPKKHIKKGPLENLWVQSPIFPFNHLISHNKTSKCCCFFSNKICCFCKI